MKRGTMLKRKIIIVFSTMFLFSLVSYMLIAAFGRKESVRDKEEKTVVTSFYPVYLITKNLVQEVEGVQVLNLTENHTGCLHDYQLTTKDMLLLETADLLVINGGGMELFIEQAVKKLAGLAIIDSCEGIELLAGEPHNHEHSDEHGSENALSAVLTRQEVSEKETKEEGKTKGAAGTKEDLEIEETAAENGHVWMDMGRYSMQIHTIADGLCRIFPDREEQIAANEAAYLEKITALSLEYADLKELLSQVPVITFHDAFVYLCDSLNMEIVHTLDLDADSALSAGEIAMIEDEIHLHNVRYLLADMENGGIAEQIAAESGCEVLYLNPLTFGADELNAYLSGMRTNFEQLKQILR